MIAPVRIAAGSIVVAEAVGAGVAVEEAADGFGVSVVAGVVVGHGSGLGSQMDGVVEPTLAVAPAAGW